MLPCLKLQAAQKVLLLCIGFSSTEVDALEIDLKVVDLKVDQKNLRLVNLREVSLQSTHPVEVWVKQDYTPSYAQLGDLNQNNNKNILGQKTQKTQQSNKL